MTARAHSGEGEFERHGGASPRDAPKAGWPAAECDGAPACALFLYFMVVNGTVRFEPQPARFCSARWLFTSARRAWPGACVPTYAQNPERAKGWCSCMPRSSFELCAQARARPAGAARPVGDGREASQRKLGDVQS